MNRLILKYGYPVTGVILAIFAWVIYTRISHGSDLVTLCVAAVIVWALGIAWYYFWRSRSKKVGVDVAMTYGELPPE